MNLFDFFRERKERKERELAEQQRIEYERSLKNTPHAEMLRVLRQEGGIVSIQELGGKENLPYEILDIWEQTVSEMFFLSLTPEKIRKLCDTRHLYFIRHEQYKKWDRKLQLFVDTLAGLDSLNSFSIVNPTGCLMFLNPLGEPIDDSHDDSIRKLFIAYFKKAGILP